MAADARSAISGVNLVKNGTILVKNSAAKPPYNTSKINDYQVPPTSIASYTGTYSDRLDDPTYYG